MAERKTTPEADTNKKKTGAVEVEDGALDQASGGILQSTRPSNTYVPPAAPPLVDPTGPTQSPPSTG